MTATTQDLSKSAAAALEHVALLVITTLGWSCAMKGLNWIGDVSRES